MKRASLAVFVIILFINPVVDAHGANTFQFIMRNGSIQPDDAQVTQNAESRKGAAKRVDISAGWSHFLKQMDENWNTGVVRYVNHTSRRCEPIDFGSDNQSKALYELWIHPDYYFDIFCPDLQSKDITFFSEEGENIVKSMIFDNLLPCRNKHMRYIWD